MNARKHAPVGPALLQVLSSADVGDELVHQRQHLLGRRSGVEARRQSIAPQDAQLARRAAHIHHARALRRRRRAAAQQRQQRVGHAQRARRVCVDCFLRFVGAEGVPLRTQQRLSTRHAGVAAYAAARALYAMPALFMRMSTPPYVSWSQLARRATDASSVTSSCGGARVRSAHARRARAGRTWRKGTARPTSADSSRAASAPRRSSRAVSTAVRPCAASWRTISLPMPLLPPVTCASSEDTRVTLIPRRVAWGQPQPPASTWAALRRCSAPLRPWIRSTNARL